MGALSELREFDDTGVRRAAPLFSLFSDASGSLSGIWTSERTVVLFEAVDSSLATGCDATAATNRARII